MTTITLHLGPDVHKDSITISQAGTKGEIRLFGAITNDLYTLQKTSACGGSTQVLNSGPDTSRGL